MFESYCYVYKDKKGQPKDLLLMNDKTPKESSVIFSTKFARWIKPKTKRIDKMIDDAVNEQRRKAE